MTEFDIASSIMNYVTSAEGVTSSTLSLEQVRDEVDTLRIRMLTELDMQSRFVFSFDEYFQELNVDTIRENNITIANIPSIYFRANGKPVVRYVGGSGNNTEHKLVTGNRKIWASHDPYTGKLATVYYSNGKLTFLSKNVPKKIRVEAVFRVPSELRKFNGYDYKKDHYPVSFSLADTLIGKTSESYIRTMYRILPQPNTQADIPIGPQK